MKRADETTVLQRRLSALENALGPNIGAALREAVALVARKVIESISAPFDLEGRALHIGASIGIARYPDDAENKGALLIVADKAMYAAKAAGRNRTVCWDPAISTGTNHDRGLSAPPAIPGSAVR